MTSFVPFGFEVDCYLLVFGRLTLFTVLTLPLFVLSSGHDEVHPIGGPQLKVSASALGDYFLQ
jgi:hypothetical protein